MIKIKKSEIRRVTVGEYYYPCHGQEGIEGFYKLGCLPQAIYDMSHPAHDNPASNNLEVHFSNGNKEYLSKSCFLEKYGPLEIEES